MISLKRQLEEELNISNLDLLDIGRKYDIAIENVYLDSAYSVKYAKTAASDICKQIIINGTGEKPYSEDLLSLIFRIEGRNLVPDSMISKLREVNNTFPDSDGRYNTKNVENCIVILGEIVQLFINEYYDIDAKNFMIKNGLDLETTRKPKGISKRAIFIIVISFVFILIIYGVMAKFVVSQVNEVISEANGVINEANEVNEEIRVYDQGYGYYINEDYETAYDYFLESANSGYAPAQNKLGMMYCQGYYVEKDLEESANWLLKAANQEYAPAQTHLGKHYLSGTGVSQNIDEGVKYIRKAANYGYGEAQAMLGNMYARGDFIDADYEKATYWFELAAEQNNTDALYDLSYAYANGTFVEVDYEKAYNWAKKGADLGDVKCQCALGIMYYSGLYVEQDYDMSKKFYELAAEQGYEYAIEMLETLPFY